MLFNNVQTNVHCIFANQTEIASSVQRF